MAAQVVIVHEQSMCHCVKDYRRQELGAFNSYNHCHEEKRRVNRKPDREILSKKSYIGPSPPKKNTRQHIQEVAVFSPIADNLTEVEFDRFNSHFRHIHRSTCQVSYNPPRLVCFCIYNKTRGSNERLCLADLCGIIPTDSQPDCYSSTML